MELINKKKFSLLLAGLCVAVSMDASAIPFFGRQGSSQLAKTQADDPTAGTGLMSSYTYNVQSDLSDFAFLARNFSGSNSGASAPRVSTAAEVTLTEITSGGSSSTPLPGSLALLGLGVSMLAWSRRKA